MVALGVVALLAVCWTAPIAAAGSPAIGTSAAATLQSLITHVPDVATGRVVYDEKDVSGDEMDVIDPIDDPTGGYLSVYHSPFGWVRRLAQPNYRIALAYSTDLLHWQQVAILDPGGATMPTLRAVPGGHGFLLAYEKSEGPKLRHHIRLRYYRDLADLLANRFAAQSDLPRVLSKYNEGTPSFLSIRWGGSLKRSVIELAFHYEIAWRGMPGADREGIGTLVGFHRWDADEDTWVDDLLNQRGLVGSHGDERQFDFEGRTWRVYEGQTSYDIFGDWHVALYPAGSDSMRLLKIDTAAGRFATSFGNPVVRVLRAPGGHGQVLAVTMFIFAAGGAAREAGELVYYQPI